MALICGIFSLAKKALAVYPIAGLKKCRCLELVLVFFANFFIVLSAYGAPSVSSVSGTVSHNSAVTVNGSGFGTKSPVAPAFWDAVSYSGLNNGSVIPIGGSNPWPAYCGSVRVYYKTANPRGKWTAHYSNQWSTDAAKKGALDGAVVAGASSTGKLYATWWSYFSSTPHPPDNQSNKFARLLSGGWDDPGEGTVIWEPTMIYSFAFTNRQYLPSIQGWVDWGGNYPAWNRMEMFVDSTGSHSPEFEAWANGESTGKYTSSPDQSWYVNQLGCIGFDGSNTDASQQPTVDWGEIYADSTRARVEICNASTKSGSNHCEIQIPQTTWVDGQLQIKVNQGSFADNSQAYLYVVDASGNANASGYPITFGSGGGGGDTMPPSAPSGLSVN